MGGVEVGEAGAFGVVDEDVGLDADAGELGEGEGGLAEAAHVFVHGAVGRGLAEYAPALVAGAVVRALVALAPEVVEQVWVGFGLAFADSIYIQVWGQTGAISIDFCVRALTFPQSANKLSIR